MTSLNPTISVIIPIYNVEQYLNECVESVLRQSLRDLEIILIDDGSTDTSGIICDEYLRQDSRIKVIHQKNGGLSAARNAGLKVAIGDFVYFLDSDDYIESTALEQLVNTIIEEQADAVFFDGYVFFDGCKDDPSVSRYERKSRYQTLNGRELLLSLLQNEEYRTAVPMYFYRRSYLTENRLSFLNGIIHEDELFTFLVHNADGRIAHCHEQLYARRIRPESIMTAAGALRRYNSLKCIYFELSRMYKNGQTCGKAARLYLARTAKAVLYRYSLLTPEDRETQLSEMNSFKKDVMLQHGFGDIKLKIKCSGRLMNIVYRAEYKFMRIIRRGSL